MVPVPLLEVRLQIVYLKLVQTLQVLVNGVGLSFREIMVLLPDSSLPIYHVFNVMKKATHLLINNGNGYIKV